MRTESRAAHCLVTSSCQKSDQSESRETESPHGTTTPMQQLFGDVLQHQHHLCSSRVKVQQHNTAVCLVAGNFLLDSLDSHEIQHQALSPTELHIHWPTLNRLISKLRGSCSLSQVCRQDTVWRTRPVLQYYHQTCSTTIRPTVAPSDLHPVAPSDPQHHRQTTTLHFHGCVPQPAALCCTV